MNTSVPPATDPAPSPTADTIPAPPLTFTLGPEWEHGGEFRTHVEWVNKAQSWLRGFGNGRAMLFDAKGRFCFCGEDMARARDEDAFPVSYWLRTTTSHG
jgi:hypothetical protein